MKVDVLKTEPQVQITMSASNAALLYAITNHLGGGGPNRKITDALGNSIYLALRNAGEKSVLEDYGDRELFRPNPTPSSIGLYFKETSF